VKEQAKKGNKILVVEDSLGQMLMDVKMACDDGTEIGLVSCLDRHEVMEGGAIYPEKVLDKIRAMME
jgi:hypothetical protein